MNVFRAVWEAFQEVGGIEAVRRAWEADKRTPAEKWEALRQMQDHPERIIAKAGRLYCPTCEARKDLTPGMVHEIRRRGPDWPPHCGKPMLYLTPDEITQRDVERSESRRSN